MLKIIMSTLMLFAFQSSLQAGTTPTLENTTKLYVATFNRAPDAGGLNYWANDAGLALEGIAQSFFDQPETKEAYPADSNNVDFVEAVYQNLFNRAAEVDGLVYWVGELDSGRIAKSTFILAVINGAQDTEEFGNDATILKNKTTVGLAFANAGLNDVTSAKEIMLGVTDIESTITSALNDYNIDPSISDDFEDGIAYMKTHSDVKLDSTKCTTYIGGGETVSLVWVGSVLTTPISELKSWSDIISVLSSELAPSSNMMKSIQGCKGVRDLTDFGGLSYDHAVESVVRGRNQEQSQFSDVWDTTVSQATPTIPDIDKIEEQQSDFEAYSAEIERNTVETCKEKYGHYAFMDLVTFSSIPTTKDIAVSQVMNGDAAYCQTLLLQSGDLEISGF